MEYSKNIFDDIQDIIILTDKNGNIIYANPYCCGVLGYSEGDLIEKRSLSDICVGIDSKKLKKIYKTIFGNNFYEEEKYLIKSDGSKLKVKLRASYLPISKSEYILIFAKVVLSKTNGNSLMFKELLKYQNFITKSIEGIYYLNFEKPIDTKLPPWKQIKQIYKYGYISECNEAFAKMYGYNTPEDIIGKRLVEIHGSDENEINIKAFLEMINKNYTNLDVETEEVDKDGQILYFSNNSFGIIENDYLVGIWGTQIDITKRKKFEKVQNAVYKIAEETHKVKNLNELFKSIHSIVSSLMHGKNFYIALYDKESDILEFPYFVDEYDEYMLPKKFGKGLTEYVIRTGFPLLATPEKFKSLLDAGEVELIGVDSVDWLGVPLKVEDKTIGVLAVQSYTEGIRYTIEDLNILSYVSEQAAMAIERKMAEDALRFSEEKYRNYIEQSLEGIYLIKYEIPIDITLPKEKQAELIIKYGIISECNDLMVKMYGYDSKDELIGKRLIDLYGGDIEKNIEANIKFVEKGYKVQDIETCEVNKKGETVWFLNNVVGIVKEGKLISNWGSQIDITKRKKAEEENLYLQDLFSSISKAEEHLILEEDLNEGISNALCVIGKTTKVNRINLFENIINYETRDVCMNKICEWCSDEKYELINNLIFQNIHFKGDLKSWYKDLSFGREICGNLNSFSKNIKEFLESQEIKSLLILPIFIDNRFWGSLSFEDCIKERCWHDAEINALRVLTNSIGGMIKQKKSENELREKEAEISAIISSLPDMIFVFNKYGEYLDVYAPDESLLILSKDKVLGQRFQDVLPKEIVPEIEKKFEKAFKERKTQYYDYYLDLPMGRRYFETRLNCFDTDKILAVVRDITDRKKFMEELIEAKNKAEEMSRVKTNFLANMSHELRTPLHGILGFAQILNELTDDLYLKEIANTIHKSGTRLMTTLNQILDLSRIEANKVNISYTRVEINKLIKEIVKLFEQSAKNKNLYLETRLYSEEIITETDERILADILNNLVNNAIKFTKQGGVIIESKIDDSHFYIKVIDTGIGIPTSKFDLIFQEFRQESEGFSRSFEGSGLGLSLAKKFTELLGGKIEVSSTIGKGSTFTIKFPIHSGKTITEEKQETMPITSNEPMEFFTDKKADSKSQKKKTSKLKKVLLVENDFASIELIKLFFKDKYEVDVALSGIEGLEKVNQKIYDIILMDINLGAGMTGSELTVKIREIKAYKNTPIIAMTAFAMEGDKEEFLKAGCTHYISKPFNRDEILELMENVSNS
ncbi:MAG: PAS domain S-box protein [Ignavibacteria bacterium]|nr:PAS domain S-box protein [Ignavibacteria bacterium]